MPAPNYTVGAAPPTPATQGDLWFDSTNTQLNVYNGTRFVPISGAQVPAPINGSIATSYAGLMMLPQVGGSYGASTFMPANMVGMAFDASAGRIWIVASGGGFKSVAVA